MEIYNLYQWGCAIFSLFLENDTQILISGAVLGGALLVGLFILQGFGLFAMAKRRNLSRRYLAFVPFANIYYMGKLAGRCGFFGHEMKKAEVYAMLAQIVAVVFTSTYIAAELYLYIGHGIPQSLEDATSRPIWSGLTGFSLAVSKFYEYAELFFIIISLVSELLLLVLVMGLYKTYSPKNYTLLAVLTLFVPIARFITIFALRNKAPIDYEAYMRARHDAYVRYQQQRYGGYNNPYGTPNGHGGYGNSYGNQQQPTKPQGGDPFEEFSSSGGPFEEFSSQSGNKGKGSSDGDDFFN